MEPFWLAIGLNMKAGVIRLMPEPVFLSLWVLANNNYCCFMSSIQTNLFVFPNTFRLADDRTRFDKFKLLKREISFLLWRSWWISSRTLWRNWKHEAKDSAYEISWWGPWRGSRQGRWPLNERGNWKRRTSLYGKGRHARKNILNFETLCAQ